MSTLLARKLEALGKKDAEKTSIAEEIRKLEELNVSHNGKMQFSVYKIDGLEKGMTEKDVILDYELTPSELFQAEGSMTGKAVNDVANVLAASRDIKININVRPGENTSIDSPESWRFMATQVVSDIPVDTTFRAELIGTHVATDLSSSPYANAKVKVHFKVMYDKISSLLQSKKLELQQVEKELKDIGEQIKEAKNKDKPQNSTGTKKGSVGGKKKKNTESVAADQSTDMTAYLPSMATIGNIAVSAQGLVMEYHSFILFGVTAAAIWFGGDQVSV